MIEKLLTLVVAPALAGLAIELFSYWLDKKDDNKKS